MIDTFKINGNPNYEALISPVTKGFNFTPSATVDEAYVCRAVHCNVAGTFRVMLVDDTTWTDLSVLAGVEYPLRIRRVSPDSGATCVGLM